MRNACKVLFGKPEGKRLLQRSRCRWKDNIKMDYGFLRSGVWMSEH
jgi:hypothetical protein